MTTKERLAGRLRKDGFDEIADRALKGEFSDFESESATPKVDLIKALHFFRSNDGNDLAREVMNGDFDDTKEESEAWFRTAGGTRVDL